MKSTFTNKEIQLLILIIILSLIRGIYNLYIIYISRNKNVDYIQNIVEKGKDFSLFNIIQFILSTLYLLTSAYFLLTGKIQSLLFGIVCAFMFARGFLYFMLRGTDDIPFIPDDMEPRVIYYNFMIANIIQFLTAFYFIKVIFF